MDVELTLPQQIVVIVAVIVWGPIIVGGVVVGALAFMADGEPGETEDARLAREQLEQKRTEKHGDRRREGSERSDERGTGRPCDEAA